MISIKTQIAKSIYITYKLYSSTTSINHNRCVIVASKISSLSEEYKEIVDLLYESQNSIKWSQRYLNITTFDKFGLLEEQLKTTFSELIEQIEEHFTAKPIILGPNNEKYLAFSDIADFINKYKEVCCKTC